MPKEEESQGKILLYQLLQAQLEELRKQSLMIENRVIEMETTEHALEEIKGTGKGNDTLVPLGSGCFAHGSVKGPGVLMDIGAGIMVNRSAASARSFLEERKKEIKDASRKVQVQMENVSGNLNELTPEIEKIVRERQQER